VLRLVNFGRCPISFLSHCVSLEKREESSMTRADEQMHKPYFDAKLLITLITTLDAKMKKMMMMMING
jgi:hypothetical protein